MPGGSDWLTCALGLPHFFPVRSEHRRPLSASSPLMRVLKHTKLKQVSGGAKRLGRREDKPDRGQGDAIVRHDCPADDTTSRGRHVCGTLGHHLNTFCAASAKAR